MDDSILNFLFLPVYSCFVKNTLCLKIKSPRLQGLLGLLWYGFEAFPKRFMCWRLGPQLVVPLRSDLLVNGLICWWVNSWRGCQESGLPGGSGTLEAWLWRAYLFLGHLLLALSVSWLSQVSGFLPPCHSPTSLSCCGPKQWIHWAWTEAVESMWLTLSVLPLADFPGIFDTGKEGYSYKDRLSELSWCHWHYLPQYICFIFFEQLSRLVNEYCL